MKKAKRLIRISLKLLEIIEKEKIDWDDMEKISYTGFLNQLYEIEHPKKERE